MQYINKEEAANLIREAQQTGLFFAVTFVKRTTGEVRQMNCRGRVKKGAKGVGLKFDPNKKNLVSVWDREKQEFRLISLENIQRISCKRKEYIVRE